MRQSILDINNEACMLISNEDYKQALHLLNRGLTMVQSVLDNSYAENNVEESLRKESELKGMGGVANVQDIISARKKRMSCYDSYEKGEEFIYSHPIPVLDMPEEDGEYVISVIIVFNMALCHHLIALNGNRPDRNSRLRGALKLYELGFCMLLKGDVEMNMTYSLAMVNNCAQIYNGLNRPAKAQKFLGHMLSSLMMMIENGEAETVDELDGFLWNASRLILKQTVASAA